MEIGPLEWSHPEIDLTTLGDTVHGYQPGQPSIKIGTLNGVFDNTAVSGLHTIASGSTYQDSAHDVMVPVGIAAAAAQGDSVFLAYATMLGYRFVDSGGAATVTIPFGEWNGIDRTGLLPTQYMIRPWGWLLHAKGAETAVNTAIGIDPNTGNTNGWVYGYQLFSSNGTVTLKIQNADTNSDGSFADLTGATSGSIDATTTPVAGLLTASSAFAVKRYLRWQLVLGTATTATFAMAYARIR
jgi:hypothetical protein